MVHGAVIDVTRQVRDRVMLERLSTTDSVTNLGNRLADVGRAAAALAAGLELAAGWRPLGLLAAGRPSLSR